MIAFVLSIAVVNISNANVLCKHCLQVVYVQNAVEIFFITSGSRRFLVSGTQCRVMQLHCSNSLIQSTFWEFRPVIGTRNYHRSFVGHDRPFLWSLLINAFELLFLLPRLLKSEKVSYISNYSERDLSQNKVQTGTFYISNFICFLLAFFHFKTCGSPPVCFSTAHSFNVEGILLRESALFTSTCQLHNLT